LGEIKVRVLQINTVCGLGSTGRIATDIHAILKEQGHESYIAYGRDTPISCNTPIKIGNKIDNYAHVVITRIFDKHGFGSKKATKEFIDKIIELDPDVIHLHNIHGYYINVELLFDYLKRADKPVVWTLHDCWSFTGHCSHFDFIGCECWKGNHKCIQKGMYPASLFFNNSIDNFKRKRDAFTGVRNLTIITPSKWLANLVKQSFLSEYPIQVINNGIDLNLFKPTSSNFKSQYNINNKFVILGVANIWNERKGFEYFKKLSDFLTENEVIVLVGLSAKQMNALPKNIVGIAKTNSVKELAEIYTAADVFVNPTLEDNFPTTNLEALACGTPVITFDTGGSIESVLNGCGFITEKGNLNELITNIYKIKKNGKLKYQEQCVNIGKMYFDKSLTYERYLDLYRD
jgi:putative colanic acid biosynthesis glycosyltransferase